jgi:hypothetical protein
MDVCMLIPVKEVTEKWVREAREEQRCQVDKASVALVYIALPTESIHDLQY